MKQRHGARRAVGRLVVAGGAVVLMANCFPGAELGFLEGVELEQAQSCSDLEDGMKQRALDQAELRALMAVTGGRVSPNGFDTSPQFSDTNNQERGVHEADLMQVDEHFAYVLHGDKLVIVEALGAEKTTDAGETFQIEGAKAISELSVGGQGLEMFIAGDRALILVRSQRQEVKELFRTGAPARAEDLPMLKAVLVDITDRAQPTVMRELLFEGQYVSARRVDGRAFLVLKADLQTEPQDDSDPASDGWLTRRRDAISASNLDGFLPNYYDIRHLGDGRTVKDVKRCSCRDTFQSPASGGDSTLTIYAIDLDKGGSDVANTTIVGDGAHVYATDASLVVALTGYDSRDDDGGDFFGEDTASAEQTQVTYLHRFTTDATGDVRYNASGRVDGWLLNQFAMSEHNGHLRVATQIGERGSVEAESAVFTLKLSSKEGELFNIGGQNDRYLKVVGQVDGIAPGEDMYAARFVGSRAYLVTFQQTDPLWNIDLSDPRSPRILGELEVPGFSTYLHPIEDNRLLAIGRLDSAVKLSIFDVGRNDPRVVREKEVGRTGANSEALTDHRAFRYMPERGLLAIPLELSRSRGLQLYDIQGRTPLERVGGVEHDDMAQGGDPIIRRSYRVGDYLYTWSAVGVAITDLNSFDTVATVDLPDLR